MKHLPSVITRLFSAALWALSLTASAEACTVCFGQSNSEWTRGFFWGILVLLILTFSLIAGLVTAVVRSGRKHPHDLHDTTVTP